MELDKLSKRLHSNITKAYTKDIIKLVEESFFEYDIFYKDTNQKVDKQNFLKKFLWIFEENDNQSKICNGFSQNGNKCYRRVFEDTNYCKTHQYLNFKKSETVKISNDIYFIDQSQSNFNNQLNINNLKTQEIDGSFYYIDNNFVYDKHTLERVGYVEQNKYFLTDDPFILSF